MNRILSYQITKNYTSIQEFLKKQGYSHLLLSRLKQQPDFVLKNSVPAYLRTPLSCQDHLQITIAEVPSSVYVTPVSMPLDILYEDEDILIVNKPAGIPVHPSVSHHEDTLANGVRHYYQSQGKPFTFHCITRLDRDTSGLVLLALNPLSACILNQMTRDHQIHKRYLALVDGILPPDRPFSYHEIHAPIARVAGSPLMRCVDFEKGRDAVTRYQVLSVGFSFSLVSLVLLTGRTHQIRVHMASIKHPLLGDFLYNPENHVLARQALHAAELSFLHPITKEELLFKAPLPTDMRLLCEDLSHPVSFM